MRIVYESALNRCRISRTAFLYHLELFHGDVSLLNESRPGGNGNDANLVRLASKHLKREGKYRARITLEDGYCHSEETNCTCVLDDASLSFDVVCGVGFRADLDRKCMKESFDRFCNHANVSIGSKVLSGADAFGEIGESGDLKVAVGWPGVRELEVVLVPINTLRGPINTQGRFMAALTKTGDFTALVRETNGSSACSLQSNLRIKCKESHDQVGTQCVMKRDPAKAKLHIVLGISVGIVLALCVVFFLFLVLISGLIVCTAHFASVVSCRCAVTRNVPRRSGCPSCVPSPTNMLRT